MSRHQEITMTTGMPIYFCYPYSPWQRGSNENTNGLLREYFPKSTELSFHGPGILENVAAELNRQPRKRHGYRTPAEVLAELVSNPVNEFRCCRHHRNSPRFRDIFGGIRTRDGLSLLRHRRGRLWSVTRSVCVSLMKPSIGTRQLNWNGLMTCTGQRTVNASPGSACRRLNGHGRSWPCPRSLTPRLSEAVGLPPPGMFPAQKVHRPGGIWKLHGRATADQFRHDTPGASYQAVRKSKSYGALRHSYADRGPGAFASFRDTIPMADETPHIPRVSSPGASRERLSWADP
jgi:hypothetical protein